ncbi:carboxypeptidase-like regulatory domain-containing protein [Larkinella soli]|uniref:carboxypeptidase-like regulatory domain-containing protein n=1 Tax=Larkinella soli TaxID=1770527 RepID=UPI001E59E9E4|nr:carboxypeptidase-like regulatory domain-containing protein [Larkinella soli]
MNRRSSCRSRRACNASAWLILFGLLLGTGYLAFGQKKAAKKPFQGICGTVVFKSGNLMPGPDRPQAKGKPVVREIRIYELTHKDQTEAADDGFYSDVKTRLVKTATSGKDGRFCVRLPAGTYSVFVKEDKGLYANLFDGQNNINPVTVKKNRRTSLPFEITHQAVF